MEEFNSQKLQSILDEVSQYSVELEPDPTLPNLGNLYLQRVISECRNYMNRVMHYMQMIKIQEKNTKIRLKAFELDLERKIAEKLSDDALVRKQPSIEDRKALAMTMLSEEYESIAILRSNLLDVEETWKLLKVKYDHLRGTSQDIKMQRSLVKDDAMLRLGGQDGYSAPQINQDKSVPNGMRAPVTTDDLNPEDILDPNKRPEELPIPKDAVHARMISDFLTSQSPKVHKESVKVDDEPVRSINYDDLLS
jgi:hypothetical protein